MPELKQVGILGLQRSGTTYLMWLIRNNFDADIRKAIWKHSLPTDKLDWLKNPMPRAAINVKPEPTVLIYKTLEHWKDSIDREAKDFYKMRGHVGLDQFYSDYHSAWSGSVKFIKYEDFITDFKLNLHKLGEIIGQKPKSYKEPYKVPSSPDWKPEHKERYA